ncbi:TSUP family transporter [Nesterenkonia pannonica]|uniref:TSUP family transporter n=1 Tax=Nesterenkonia pannonica TaxID=1548602 RepID=UPI0021648223|nr:TSUP family transporter [Nesterenkonia pannonica]
MGQLSAGWLSIILGSIVVAALVVTFTLRSLPEWTGRVPVMLAGGIGGFFNTTSGVAAPVMVIHSRLARWDHRSFAATLQPIFMTMGAVSALSKLLMGSVEATPMEGLPELPYLFLGIVCFVVVGIYIGTRLARFVPVRWARAAAMVLAALGGAGAIVRGVFDVLA